MNTMTMLPAIAWMLWRLKLALLCESTDLLNNNSSNNALMPDPVMSEHLEKY
jgi:hypothetical protein